VLDPYNNWQYPYEDGERNMNDTPFPGDDGRSDSVDGPIARLNERVIETRMEDGTVQKRLVLADHDGLMQEWLAFGVGGS